jgi:hypothetical protein
MENIENVKPQRRSLNDEFLGFRGSENYYRHSNLFSRFFLTDGVKHITDKIGLCWFLDTVLSYQGERMVKAVRFQIWTLERLIEGESTGQWKVVMYLDKTPVITQLFDTISLTDDYEDDFDIFKIYLADNILFLPSEN